MTERIGHALPPPLGRAPVLNIAPRDVEGLGDELVSYQQLFANAFVRWEQRHWALKYSQGQMLDRERKSIEPMAVAVAGAAAGDWGAAGAVEILSFECLG